MMGLPDGRKKFKISLTVQTQYRRVTDGQTDRHVAVEKTALSYASRTRVKRSFNIFILTPLLLIEDVVKQIHLAFSESGPLSPPGH